MNPIFSPWYSLVRSLFLKMALPVFCLLFLLCNSCALVGCLNDEGWALLSFKQSIQQYPKGLLNNWNSSDVNPCAWNGIRCSEYRVVSLSIAKQKLAGFIHPALGNLSELRNVNLRHNRFNGSLPVELFNARSLQRLVLSGNSLNGSLPSEIGKLRYIQILDLWGNSFSGSIPSSLIQCTKLKTLVLSKNNFTGSLPIGLGTNLTALQNLDLSFNRLSGSVPSDLGNLSNLRGYLILSHNFFTGHIPPSLGSLPLTVYIDLSFNNLSGVIPQNGVLENVGPTAFIGNPLLCGLPLKKPCPLTSPRSFPMLNQSPGKSGKSRHLGIGVVISIVVSIILGIGLVGFLIFSYHRNVCACKRGENANGHNSEKGLMGSECFIFRRDVSETLSENAEQYGLVPLDSRVDFNLDELLKASAFVLGKSKFGIVYKVVLGKKPTLAVRRLVDDAFQRFKEFQTEIEAIGKIRHPNIVSLRAYCWSAEEKLLIYDYIPNDDLATAIHGKAGLMKSTPLSWHVRLKIMKGIAKGLAYLHEFSPKKYVHGDLKPSNILLGQNMEPHIADFGLGRLVNLAEGSPTLQYTWMTSGTPEQNSPYELTTISPSMNVGSYYQAPEAFKVPKPSQKWDVFSYGIILQEMISGKSPMIQGRSSGVDLVRWIQLCIEKDKTLPDILDPFLVRDLDKEGEMVTVLKIALACAQDNPDKRPSMRHVSDTLDKMATSAD